MELVQSHGAVLYDRASGAGLCFFVFPPPLPGSEPHDWESWDRGPHGFFPPYCAVDPSLLPHALVPMLAGLTFDRVVAEVTTAKDDPESFRQHFSHPLVTMAERAVAAQIIPLQGAPRGFQSLASFASQPRRDPGAFISASARSEVTPLLVVSGQEANVVVKSTTAGDANYANFNHLDDFLRRMFMDVPAISPGDQPFSSLGG